MRRCAECDRQGALPRLCRRVRHVVTDTLWCGCGEDGTRHAGTVIGDGTRHVRAGTVIGEVQSRWPCSSVSAPGMGRRQGSSMHAPCNATRCTAAAVGANSQPDIALAGSVGMIHDACAATARCAGRCVVATLCGHREFAIVGKVRGDVTDDDGKVHMQAVWRGEDLRTVHRRTARC